MCLAMPGEALLGKGVDMLLEGAGSSFRLSAKLPFRRMSDYMTRIGTAEYTPYDKGGIMHGVMDDLQKTFLSQKTLVQQQYLQFSRTDTITSYYSERIAATQKSIREVNALISKQYELYFQKTKYTMDDKQLQLAQLQRDFNLNEFAQEKNALQTQLNSLRREKYDYLKMKLKRDDMYYYGFGERIEEEGNEPMGMNIYIHLKELINQSSGETEDEMLRHTEEHVMYYGIAKVLALDLAWTGASMIPYGEIKSKIQ